MTRQYRKERQHMTGKTHLMIGTTLAYMACAKSNINFSIAAAAYAAVGSLLPDIDEKHSTINQYIPMNLGKLIYGIVGIALAYHIYETGNIAYVLPSALLILIYFSGHRGFTHSITACILFSMAFIEGRNTLIPFVAGYLAHLIFDMFNTKGILLIYPLKKRFKFPLNFSTDSVLGKTFELVFNGMCICYWLIILV